MRNRENRQLESRRGTSNILSQKMAASLVITLEFSAFYTEPRVDFVYVFDGSETNAKILALYSGPNIPPPVVSLHNKMLVWFVTNETCRAKDGKRNIL